jgi:hypothetical protein
MGIGLRLSLENSRGRSSIDAMRFSRMSSMALARRAKRKITVLREAIR